jgi:hypothetical protein
MHVCMYVCMYEENIMTLVREAVSMHTVRTQEKKNRKNHHTEVLLVHSISTKRKMISSDDTAESKKN